MNVSSRRTKQWICTGAVAVATLVGCSSRDAWLGDVPDPNRFVPDDDAGALAEAGVDAAAALLCPASECPAPYTTCPSDFGPTYACSVDLRRDPKHCGACGKECLSFEPIHMTSRCVEGGCVLECLSLPKYVFPDGERPTKYQNCNGLLDDGCEVDLLSDPANCGACGAACSPGVRCVEGVCGCRPGLTDCAGFCVDVASDDAHCGACGNECTDPDPSCDPMPENAGYGCGSGTCGKLKCGQGWADCNGDLVKGCASDGCETSTFDVANCGACGRVCSPGDECREENGVVDCRPTCAAVGKVQCEGFCADVLNDVESCGGCGLPCPNAGPNQQRACAKGMCVTDCVEGFGDCNGDPSDGCETDLRSHPSNCGACGVSCDGSIGQPCFEGKCLLGPCDDGVTR